MTNIQEIEASTAISAFDDFESAFETYCDITFKLPLEAEQAVEILNGIVQSIRTRFQLDLFVSDTVYGEMRMIEFRRLEPYEVVNQRGEIAGPPYYYNHINYADETLDRLREEVRNLHRVR